MGKKRRRASPGGQVGGAAPPPRTGLPLALARAAALLLFGAAVGWYVGYATGTAHGPEPDSLEIREGPVGLTNPLLECENPHYPAGQALPRFDAELRATVEDVRARGGVDRVSVYFRDLNNGPWIGVDEDESFTPGSLLKIPVLMAAFKQGEADPSFLARRVRFDGVPARERLGSFRSERPLELGQEYTVEELLRRIAVYSDNEAVSLLEGTVRPEFLRHVYLLFGLDPALVDDRTLTTSFTARGTGQYFRVLFNASYLDREASHRALDFLSQSTFAAGLTAGTPRGTLIAHKFGVYAEPGSRISLHDCGNVYFPPRPYLLCVMTEGSDIEAQAGAIAAVARFTFERVSGGTPSPLGATR